MIWICTDVLFNYFQNGPMSIPYFTILVVVFYEKGEQNWETKEGRWGKEKENISIFKVLLPCYLFAQIFDF